MGMHSFRFTPDMEKQFSDLKQWVNKDSQNFNTTLSDTKLIELLLQLVSELFVEPYEDDNSQTFVKLQQKYQRVLNGSSDIDTKKQLQNIQTLLLSIKFLGLNLAHNLDPVDVENYLVSGTHAHEIDAVINNLINESVVSVSENKK